MTGTVPDARRPQPPQAKPGRGRRVLDAVYLAAGALGAGFIVAICALMIWQSVAREFGVATGAVNDIVAWFCAAAAFLTMAHAFKHGDFVRVTLLTARAGPRLKRLLEMAALIVATIAVGYLAWWACRFTYDSWRFNEVAQGLLPLPIWIPQMSFALGSVLLWVAVIDELVTVAMGSVPTYERLLAERHAAGDFSSDV